MDLFPQQFDLPAEEFADFLPDGELLAVPLVVEEKNSDNSGPGGPIPSPSLDFNDNEDIPTELSDSSETHDEGTERERLVFFQPGGESAPLITQPLITSVYLCR